MVLARKNVLLLFGGGTALILENGTIRTVETPQDVPGWMQHIPELGIIAKVKPQFLYTGASFDEQPRWWQAVARTIAKSYRDYDGFIVTQPIDAIPYTAAALTVMLSRIGKPVVITGSTELPTGRASKKTLKAWYGNAEIGIRANLVNSAQVATQDVGEVSVLFGNQLLRGGNVVRHAEPSLNVFESAGVAPLGRVDFGLKLESHRRHRSATTPKLATGLKTRILQFSLAPTTAAPMLPTIKPKSLDGVFVSGTPHAAPPDALESILAAARPSNIPVAVYSHWPSKASDQYFTVSGVTPAMALVKFMWALAQTANRKAIQTLLNTDFVGEVIRPEKRTAV